MLVRQKRIEILAQLGEYMLSDDERWIQAKDNAHAANAWFTKEHIDIATKHIATEYLQKEKLTSWLEKYTETNAPKKVGIVMAGNIPLVGFHDFLCGFVSGHILYLKLSSKDTVLLSHLIRKLAEWDADVTTQVHIADNLKGCDAYIATGSNNTARYFEQYFGKYPNIIRKNRTSVAVLDGSETEEELSRLADDVFTYFGLGCRNVTQLCVPEEYDFTKLLEAFKKYEDLILNHKYKNNYDYHLAIYLLNKVPYITNDSVLLVENDISFSAVSVIHYKYYNNRLELLKILQKSDDIQGIIGHDLIAFGQGQCPSLSNYADGVDTMTFLEKL
jgi:hypothetical protein